MLNDRNIDLSYFEHPLLDRDPFIIRLEIPKSPERLVPSAYLLLTQALWSSECSSTVEIQPQTEIGRPFLGLQSILPDNKKTSDLDLWRVLYPNFGG